MPRWCWIGRGLPCRWARGQSPLCALLCMGAPPQTPGDFPVAGKVTKGAPEPTVLDSLSSKPPPFSRSLTHRAGLFSATERDRFATLSWWANRSCFFLWFHRGNTLCFQSVARQVRCHRRCRRFYTPATNTARAGSRGIKGATPLRRGSRDQEVPGESLVTFFS